MSTPGSALGPSRSGPSVLLGLTGLRIDGGIASVSRCIAQALDEEARAGRVARTDRVLLFENPSDPAPEPACGDQQLARGSQLRFVWQLWRSFRRERHDLVLFDLVGLARGVGLPLPGFPPPRVAIFVHSYEWLTETNVRSLQRAERLLANSRFTADRIGSGMPELVDRIRVVPLCIDPERITRWQQSGSEPAAAEREPAALIVARMWEAERGKGHDALIDAWARVRHAVPRAELWIVGTGDDAPRLMAKAREAGLADAVRFFGRVSEDELGDLYRRASVFAMPSRQEGFGLAFAEAMWWGLPCIGTTTDAAGQVIADGETGELVPYGDVPALASSLVRLFTDRERAASMGEAGRKRAREHFSYPRFRRDLLAALDLR